MDREAPDRIVQNVVIRLDNVVEHGADVIQHLKSTTKGAEKAEKQLAKLQKQFAKYDKTIKGSLAAQSKQVKRQQELSKRLRESGRRLKDNTRHLRAHRRETERSTRATKSFMGSLRSIGALIGVGGLGFLAVRRIQSVIAKRFSLALTGGADQISLIKALTGGTNTTAAIDLASRFQQQSPFARFELGKESLRGLIAAQKALEPIGLDRANELILQVTKSLEPDRLKRFLGTAETGNLERALLQAATGENVGAVTSALNALKIGDLATKEPEKLDPLLQAATRFEQASNRVADSFDKLSDKVVGKAAGLSNKQLIGVGVGGLLGFEALKFLALRRIFGGGRGIGAPPGVPTARPIPGAPPPPTPRAIIPRPPVVPTASPRVLRRIPLNPLPLAAGGIVGTGLAGAAAAGSIYTAVRSRQAAAAERQALTAQQKVLGDQRLSSIAAKNRDRARTELQKVNAKIQGLESLLLSTPQGHADVGEAGLLTRLFLPSDQPKQDKQLIAKLRKQISDLQKRKQELQKAKDESGPSLAERIAKSISDTARKIKGKAGDFAKALDDFVQKGLEANLQRLQKQAAQRQELQLTAGEQQSLTQLRRLEFAIARTTPLGVIGGVDELNRLQEQIRDEIKSLQAVLNNIDQSTRQGRIEANNIGSQVAQLRLEERQNSISLTNALLDSVLQQASAAGRFEKIIISRDQNLAAGLRTGTVTKSIPQLTGSVGKSHGRRPIRITAAMDAGSALQNLAKAAKQAAPFLEQLQADDAGVETERPTVTRGRVMMGPPQ